MIAAGPRPALAVPSDEEIRTAVESVLADGRFQSELPNEAEPAEIINPHVTPVEPKKSSAKKTTARTASMVRVIQNPYVK